jgi:hypothetical protein
MICEHGTIRGFGAFPNSACRLESAMLRQWITNCALAALLSSTALVAAAADAVPSQESARSDGRVYGSHLMTRQERDEYRAKKRAAKTADERDRIRKEHNERMKARAKDRAAAAAAKPATP